MTQARWQPPRLAAWLVELFTSADQAECILGDLAEEFSDLASRSRVVSAHLWYWRQCLKSITHLAGSAIRCSSLPFWGTVLFGFLMMWVGADLPEGLIVALLRTQRPYSNLHVAAYIRFVTCGIPIARVMQSLVIGCLVAASAKGREVVATIALSISRGVLMLPLLFPWLARRVSDQSSVFEFGTYWALNAVELSALVVAGVTVRKFRALAVRGLAAS